MEKEITINGIRLFYEESGKDGGVPVVLMHGWGCDHTTVKSIASILEPGMKVYNIDLPGHGKSQEPTEVWGIEEFTRTVEQFIAQLKYLSTCINRAFFRGTYCYSIIFKK